MDEPPFALVCGWRYPLLIIAKGGSFSTVSTLRLHSSTSLACGFSYEQKQDVRHPDAPCQDPQTIAICTTGRSPSERPVFLCWRCDEPVPPAKASSRLRSNKSPSGAFKRPNGLALARWRGLRPDKLGGICDKEYHGLRSASRWFCKFYCSKAVIVGLIGFGALIRDMDDNSC